MSISRELGGKPIDVEFQIWGRGGEFGILSKRPRAKTEQYQVNQTYDCRETFATSWGRAVRGGTGNISLSTHPKTRVKVARFIKKLEDKLGLKERTTCHRIIGRTSGMIIKPSNWWLRSAMRRSIFTIFLRAGKKYNGDFDAAIKTQRYFRLTKDAVDRFLEGNTYYRGASGGWVNVFSYAGKLKIGKRLRPETEDRKPRIPVFGESMDVHFRSLGRAQTGNFAPLIERKRNPKHRTEYWSYCREKMDGRKWSSIVFCHQRTQGRYVAEFLRRIERRLKLKKYSECGPTNRNHIMWIKVSPFWRSTKMRTSFFTALLRSSIEYNPTKTGTYTKALTETKYFKPTAYAVKLFLRGYTGWNAKVRGRKSRWTGRYLMKSKPFTGWVNEFSDSRIRDKVEHKKQVRRMLKKVVQK